MIDVLHRCVCKASKARHLGVRKDEHEASKYVIL
jgi:hypothetical protein